VTRVNSLPIDAELHLDENNLIHQYNEYLSFRNSTDSGIYSNARDYTLTRSYPWKVIINEELDRNDVTDAINAQTQTENEIFFARALLLGSSILYGTSFTFVKILDEYIPVGVSATVRFAIAALVTLPWILLKPLNEDNAVVEYQQDNIGAWNVFLAGAEVGLWNSLGYISQAVGLQTTDASKSAFICSLAVVVVPILEALNGKRISSAKILSVAMAVAGVAFLELGPQLLSAQPSTTLSFTTDDFATLLQPIPFGIGFWRMEHAMRSHPTQAMRLTATQMLTVALSSSLYCASGLGGSPPPTFSQMLSWLSDPTTLMAILWTGVIATALAIYMETRAMKTVSAAEATLIMSSEPIWGSAFAAALCGEHFGIAAGIGALFILGGCLLGNVLSFGEHPMS